MKYTGGKIKSFALIAVLLILFITGCGKKNDFSRTGSKPADIVIFNAEVITCDNNNTIAEAVAVSGGKIIYTGTDDGIADFVGPATTVINGHGRTVTPGFVDNHCHVLWIGALRSLMTTDLFNCESIYEVKEIMLRQASKHPDELMVLGQGYKQYYIPKNANQLEIIDSWIKDRPAAMMSYSGGGGWVNSNMLELMQKRNPEAFIRLAPHKNSKGEYNGLFKHFHAFNPLDFASIEELGPGVKEKMFNAMNKSLSDALSVGVTTMDDVQIYKTFIPLLLEFRDNGGLDNVRVRCGYYIPNTVLSDEEAFKNDLLWWKETGKTKSDSHLIMGKSVKLYIDGVPSNHTSFQFEPFSDAKGIYGDQVWSQENFNRVMEIVDSLEFQACTHSCGDAGINRVINAYEHVYQLHGRRDMRHRSDHCSGPAIEDIKRLSQVGVYAVMQPTHFFGDKSVEDALGTERLIKSHPWRSLEKAGVNISFGSDWCAGPINPVYGLIIAGSRVNYNGNTDWGEDEKISLENAIRYWTVGSAKALFLENEIGSIETGKYADLVIFNTCPLDVTSWWFLLTHDIELGKLDDFVDFTITGGKIVYKKNDAEM